MHGNILYLTLSLVILTMFIIWITPKVTKFIPAPLMAIIIITFIVIFGNLDVLRVGDMANISGNFPSFNIPEIPLEISSLKVILPYAFLQIIKQDIKKFGYKC